MARPKQEEPPHQAQVIAAAPGFYVLLPYQADDDRTGRPFGVLALPVLAWVVTFQHDPKNEGAISNQNAAPVTTWEGFDPDDGGQAYVEGPTGEVVYCGGVVATDRAALLAYWQAEFDAKKSL